MRVVFALMLFVGMICFVDLETSTPPFCISEESTQANANQYDKNCAPVSRAIVAYLIDGSIALGHLIRDFKDEIIAAFTVLLAVSTAYLWRATRDLVRGAEDASKRQLRPYIIVKGKDITEQDETHGRFIHFLKVVNAGQTPAYHLRGITRCHALNHPIPRNFDFTIPPGENQSVMMLGPGQSTGHNSYADETLTPIDLITIKSNGPWRLYNYGTFIYEDSFGTEYRTNFCYFFDFIFSTDVATGESSSVTALQATPHHNDAS